MSNHWTSLWRAGVLHSCSTGIEGNYDGEFAGFWTRQFSAVPAGGLVADIGTGNGALLLLAKSCSTGLRLHGVDSARISPASDITDGQSRYAGITFHAGCNMEQLPFADGSVNLLTSQYAFEYAPREQTVAEITRVVATGGHVAMIIHSTGSEIALTSERQKSGFNLLFNELDIFQKAMVLARAVAACPAHVRSRLSSDPTIEGYRHDFNQVAGVLIEKLSDPSHPPVLEKAYTVVLQAMKSLQSNPGDSVSRLESAAAQLRDEWQRVIDMGQSAHTAEDLEQVVALFRDRGFKVETGTISQKGVPMGWTLIAHHG